MNVFEKKQTYLWKESISSITQKTLKELKQSLIEDRIYCFTITKSYIINKECLLTSQL